MNGLNLGFMKKLMLTVLLGVVHMVYHSNASAYLTYKNTATPEECTSYCTTNVGLWGTAILMAMGAAGSDTGSPYVPGGYSSTKCVCVTSAEYSSMTNCRAMLCSNYISGGVENHNVRYNLVAASCNVYDGCDCAVGYYKYSSTYCSNCMPGYYCKGWTSSSVCPKGSYSSGWAASTCTVCSAGYYADQQGMSACKPCSGGRYQPSSGQSSCLPCGTNSYTNQESGATACYLCPSYYPASGTTPSSVSALASSLTSTPSGCYIEGGREFTEPSGDIWKWTGDCYYVS